MRRSISYLVKVGIFVVFTSTVPLVLLYGVLGLMIKLEAFLVRGVPRTDNVNM